MRLFCFVLMLLCHAASGQTVIFDEKHFNSVNQNGIFRSQAERQMNLDLFNIKYDIEDINKNIGVVMTAQHMIYRSLTEVDGAIRHGKNVKYLGELVSDIVQNGNNVVQMGKKDPLLLPFAEKVSRQMKERAMALVTQVSSFVLKGSRKTMMNYNSRDELLQYVMTELRILRGLSYAAVQSMRYARLRGTLGSLNPFQDYIDKDISNIREIIRKVDYLR